MKRLWLKRALITITFLLILAVVGFAAFLTGLGSGYLAKTEAASLTEEVISGEQLEPKIGILRLEGLIVSSGPSTPLPTGQGLITSNQVKRWLREISDDDNLKSLVLEVNSPGGSPVAADEIYQALGRLRNRGKSVVVVMEDTATSGAYFISVAADRIIASPATLTGSIGVIAEITNVQELLSKLGVDIEVYKSGEFKDMTSFSRERTQEEEAMIQEYIDTTHRLFVKRVAEGRSMEREEVAALAEGQIFSGEKALEAGLIDSLGSLEDGIQQAKDLQGITAAKIVRYRTESPLDILLGRAGALLNPLGSVLLRFYTPGIKVFYLPSL